ncbi:hypothetical protein [Gimesia maris]|uniref:hypothetical protein n=1 Tax=Gimesia maris TaxID=122 RepID=UPI0032EB39AF
MTQQEKIDRFWLWFESQAERLFEQPSLEIIDKLTEQLATVDWGISCEVSQVTTCSDRELILTAHSDILRFELIGTLVQRAPQIPNWRVLALKPPRGFAFHIDGKERLSISDWRFVPLKSSPDFSEFGLRIEMPEQDARLLDADSLSLILETGVGEVLLSLCSHIEFGSSKTAGALSIHSLAETISDWALVRGPKSMRAWLPTLEQH